MRIVIAGIGFAVLCFGQSSFVAEGRLVGGGAIQGLSVEASEGGGTVGLAKAHVHSDSTFRMELPLHVRTLEFRILNFRGEVIQVIHQWPQRGVPIELHLTEGEATVPPARAGISVHRLAFRPSSKLRRAFALSQKLRMAGKKAEWKAALQGIVIREPAWFEAWLELGMGQAVLGESAAAAHSLRQALAIDPNAAEVYPPLGLALLRSGLVPEAAEMAEKGLKLDTDSMKSKYVLGLAMSTAQTPSLRAVALLEEVQSHFPDAMLPLAALLQGLGEFAASRDAAWRYLHMAKAPRAEMAGSIWREATLALRASEGQ